MEEVFWVIISFMSIGIPKEIKPNEYRVALTPDGCGELKREGHEIYIEKNAGIGSGFADESYLPKGAKITSREELFENAELIVKVKEPLTEEYNLLKESHILFTFLHLASSPELIRVLQKKGLIAIGYETVTRHNELPILTPMSEIAGEIAPIMGSYYLQRYLGGSGILPSGAVGVPNAKCVILGAGKVGCSAARVAYGIGMDVTVLNKGVKRLRQMDELYKGHIKTLSLTKENIISAIQDADIIVCAILIPGEKAPKLITRKMLSSMKKGSVIVDVSIDQGGCTETSKPTTHDNPVFSVDGVLHYCVANMPGAYPRTSTIALTNETLPYIRCIADSGIEKAMQKDEAIRSGVNIYKGKVVHEGLARSLNLKAESL